MDDALDLKQAVTHFSSCGLQTCQSLDVHRNTKLVLRLLLEKENFQTAYVHLDTQNFTTWGGGGAVLDNRIYLNGGRECVQIVLLILPLGRPGVGHLQKLGVPHSCR